MSINPKQKKTGGSIQYQTEQAEKKYNDKERNFIMIKCQFNRHEFMCAHKITSTYIKQYLTEIKDIQTNQTSQLLISLSTMDKESFPGWCGSVD